MTQNLLLDKIYIQDVFSFLETLPNNIIDLAVVDPPYNLKVAEWDTFKNENEFLDFSFRWIDSMLLKLKPNASFYIFNTPYNSALFLNYLIDKAYFKNWISWYKKDGLSYTKKRYVNNQEIILFYTMHSSKYYFDYDNIRIPYTSTDRISHATEKGILKNGKRWYPNPKGKLCPDIWEISSARHKNKVNGKTIKLGHPTPKPRDMIERIIKASSKDGDLILDLFSGTGITSIVSKDLGRHFIGCELNEKYIDENIQKILLK